MAQRTILFAIDLGTSSTTANHCFVIDSRDPHGKVFRRKPPGVNVREIQDWPGSNENETIGNIYLPTDLIYDKGTGQLLYWGFDAKRYLNNDDPIQEIKPELVFHVEHIKLLIPDPEKAKCVTPASDRYIALRKELIRVLGRQPHEIFEDFMDRVVEHIVTNAHERYRIGLGNDKIELILAFPSGWDDYIHTTVAEIGARAMQKAIRTLQLQNVKFGIENVHTVSETLCGVKEWFRDAIAEAAVSNEYIATTNLDELREGECFLPCDIGGGTGCITPLRLVSKDPLRVDQLGPTQSLEVSGEAVEAEFEKYIRRLIKKGDYPKDMDRLISQIRRRFKEVKKNCGENTTGGTRPIYFKARGIRSIPSKGFEKGSIKIEQKYIEASFDKVIGVLEEAIKNTLQTYPDIKTIVFLGQFGGNSKYFRKQMAASELTKDAKFKDLKIRHSQAGKLNVVKGAMSERLQLNDKFVRKFQTLKSYGTLVTMEWYPDSKAQKLFPNARQEDAIFEREYGVSYVKIIEWAIPKGTMLDNVANEDAGKVSGSRYHTWPVTDRRISFEDEIVVSDEPTPAPQSENESLTLWTRAHERNELYHDNQRLHVQLLPFSWNIAMSVKLDANGESIGPYARDEMDEDYHTPKNKRSKTKLRKLNYELLWEITEMQVKLHIRPLFPGCDRPTTQLAEQLALTPSDGTPSGESRSKALEDDIKLVMAASEAATEPHVAVAPVVIDLGYAAEEIEEVDDERRPVSVSEIVGAAGAELVDKLVPEYDVWSAPGSPQRLPADTRSFFGRHELNLAVSRPSQHPPKQPDSFAESMSNLDGRRRSGCFTCKREKKKCDCTFTVSETTKAISCATCLRRRLVCHMSKPEGVKGKEAAKAYRIQRKDQIKLGKRKVREESESSGTISRDRSMTVNPDFSMFVSNVRQSVEVRPDVYATPPVPTPTKRTWTAVRSGKHGSKHSKH